jgi:hypothetical protein
MRLHEIKEGLPATEVLAESTTPIHITMMLNEVIKAGKITNTAQVVILGQLVELFKYAPYNGQQGQAIEIPKFTSAIKPRYMYEQQPSKKVYDDIRALVAEDQVKLAYWCATQLALAEADEQLAKWVNPQMGLSAWIQYVSQAQD